ILHILEKDDSPPYFNPRILPFRLLPPPPILNPRINHRQRPQLDTVLSWAIQQQGINRLKPLINKHHFTVVD
ncbi:MAG: hypothetical protein WBD56_12565, partial [Anaerolineales bacterium]